MVSLEGYSVRTVATAGKVSIVVYERDDRHEDRPEGSSGPAVVIEKLGLRNIVFADLNGNGELDEGDKKLEVEVVQKVCDGVETPTCRGGKFELTDVGTEDIARFGEEFKRLAAGVQGERSRIKELDPKIEDGNCTFIESVGRQGGRRARFTINLGIEDRGASEEGSLTIDEYNMRALPGIEYPPINPHTCISAGGTIKIAIEGETLDLTIVTGNRLGFSPEETLRKLGLEDTNLADVGYSRMTDGTEVLYSHIDIAGE